MLRNPSGSHSSQGTYFDVAGASQLPWCYHFNGPRNLIIFISGWNSYACFQSIPTAKKFLKIINMFTSWHQACWLLILIFWVSKPNQKMKIREFKSDIIDERQKFIIHILAANFESKKQQRHTSKFSNKPITNVWCCLRNFLASVSDDSLTTGAPVFLVAHITNSSLLNNKYQQEAELNYS